MEMPNNCTLCDVPTQGRDFSPLNEIDRAHVFSYRTNSDIDKLIVFCQDCWKKTRDVVHTLNDRSKQNA